jgi:hypothetical protein
VLSVRPPDRWFASFHETIYQVLLREQPAGVDVPAPFATLIEFADRVVRLRSFGPRLAEMTRAEMIATYEAHNAEVRAGVPADRLLVFDVAQGWEPLCRFLDVDMPAHPFPNMNDREQFHTLFGLGDALLEPPTLDEFQDRFRGATDG